VLMIAFLFRDNRYCVGRRAALSTKFISPASSNPGIRKTAMMVGPNAGAGRNHVRLPWTRGRAFISAGRSTTGSHR
jgi:hypothetical protein